MQTRSSPTPAPTSVVLPAAQDLAIHNSLSRQKEAFVPLTPGVVKLYVCGMTVYDYCHMGHAKSLVSFDVVVRYLRALGFSVTFVRNITDIDDKIINRALENNESIDTLTERFIQAMDEDCLALSVLKPCDEPRATQHVSTIIALIEQLIANNHAYASVEGDVYYDISRFATYGQLANKQLDELQSGARVSVDANKRDPLDFVLWKRAKPDEPSWDSPWGVGRPGWHIECSAMATHCLGATFDIHGGGGDLLFPHHENEIAQSEAATGQHYVNYWMHNGFVQVDGEKMSKSLGNFFTIRDVLSHYSGEVLRYFIVASHYRSPLHYADPYIQQAEESLTRLYNALRDVPDVFDQPVLPLSALITHNDETVVGYVNRFVTAMNDDFNTPQALAVLHELATELNREKHSSAPSVERMQVFAHVLKSLGAILGLLQQEPDSFLQGSSSHGVNLQNALDVTAIEQLVTEREQARQDKNWARADQVRDELLAKGVVLEDRDGKTRWRRATGVQPSITP